MKDLVLIPDDEPGALARIGLAAGQAGVNIAGVSAFTGEGKGLIHMLVDHAEAAVEALSAIGMDVRAVRDVLVIDLPDQPGALGAACQRLAEGDVNVQQAYIANGSRLVLVVDDLDAGKAVLEG